MKIPNSTPSDSTGHTGCAVQSKRNWITPRQIMVAGLALVLWAMLMPAALAQTANFKSPLLRVTVPVGFAGITVLSNNLSIGTNGMVQDGNGNMIISPVSLSVAGLPSGVTYSITNFPGGTNFVSTSLRTNSSTTYNLSLNLFFDGSTPEGTYTFSESASGGAANIILYTIDVAHIWNGSTNTLLNAPGSWSDGSQWLGGGTPVTSQTAANVIFSDLGGQTNNTQTIVGTSTNLYVSSIIDTDVTIASLRFSETNSVNKYHTIQINPGKTLRITGSQGFSILRDYVDVLAGISTGIGVTFSGTNATMIVSNNSSIFNFLVDNGQSSSLDLSRLDTLRVTVNRFALGDWSTYPNFLYLDTNFYGNRLNGVGNASVPGKFLPPTFMARTNIIVASFVGPDNYTNSYTRQYAISCANHAYGSGANTAFIWNLGVSNAFFADSMLFGGANMGPQLAYQFNPIFSTNNPVLVIRGILGGTNRMTLLSIGDDGELGQAQSNVKHYADFGGKGRGRVDILADRMILATDPKQILGAGATPNIQGSLGYGGGTIDANTVYLGYQVSGVHTNDPGTPFLGYCQGTLTVSNTGVFKANNLISLGWTTETNNGSPTAGSETPNNRGQININNGGTVIANTILVGGVTKGSQNNNITLASAISTNVSTLIISNTIADTNMMLSALAMNGYSTLAFNIDGNRTDPYIYVTNFTTTPPNNNFYISSVRNIAGYPALIPLIAYQTGTPTIGIAPDGFVTASLIATNYGSLSGYAVLLTTNAPKNLLWRGGNGTWDFTSLVWLDQATSLMTNFAAGDIVAFDDVSGSSITVGFGVIPSAINMTNSSLKFVFSGSAIAGSGATLNKWGTGSLEFDVPSAVSLVLNQGTFTNSTSSSPSLGGATTATNTTMVFSGDINGGLAIAGTVTLLSSPNGANGTVILQSGGILTNWNTINGVPSQQAYTLVVNEGNINFASGSGTWNVVSNATLINDGTINADAITVTGTLKDTGNGSLNLYNQLQFGNGALFIPGGDGIGTTTVNGVGNSTLNGRVTFLTGSTNVFKVNLDSGIHYTVLKSGEQDFGPSSSQPNYNGGTLVITNTGITPFSAGQSFQIVRNVLGDNYDILVTGSATNSYPVMVPAAPGANLAWNIQNIVINGKVNIIALNTSPTNLLLLGITNVYQNIFTNSFTTNNLVITPNITTNEIMFVGLQWPTNHTGWKLQTQSNPLNVGLGTNWTTVFGSPWVSSITLSNQLQTNNCVFLRMVYP